MLTVTPQEVSVPKMWIPKGIHGQQDYAGMVDEILLHTSQLPYHGLYHARSVAYYISLILGEKHHLVLAGLGHDIKLGWQKNSPKDELEAAELIEKILKKRGVDDKIISEIKSAILGTIFNQRGEHNNFLSELLSDCDIVGSTGRDYQVMLDNSARLFIEFRGDKIDAVTEEEIVSFFKAGVLGFFDNLTSVTGNEDNPYLIDGLSKTFNNFPQNREQLLFDIEYRKGKLVNTVKYQWERFYGKKLEIAEE